MKGGGSIIPKRMRLRRSSAAQKADPYTLVVALSGGPVQTGSGDLYLDDGHTYDSTKKSMFQRRRFNWSGKTLTAGEAPAPFGNPSPPAEFKMAPSVTVERILVWGWPSQPAKVTITVGGETRELGFAYSNGVLGIRKPDVHIQADFTLSVV